MSRKAESAEYNRLEDLRRGPALLPRGAIPADFDDYRLLIASVRFYSEHFRIDPPVQQDLKLSALS